MDIDKMLSPIKYAWLLFLLIVYDAVWSIWGIVEAAKSDDAGGPPALMSYFALPIMCILWFCKAWLLAIRGLL